MRFGPAVFAHRFLQDPRDSPARETGIGFQRHAPTGKRIDNTEYANRASGRQRIGCEINRPFLIHFCCGLERLPDTNEVLAPPPFHARSGFAVHAPDPFAIDDIALARQQDMQSTIA
jgi:hypothetical protein